MLKNKLKQNLMSKNWYLYILKCVDNTLYTGITTDLGRRVSEHNSSDLWAKYTKTRRPVTLVYSETFSNRSEATKREIQVKKMKRSEKEKLCEAR